MSDTEPDPTLNARIATALGYRAYLKKRGDYELAVVQKPGDREPWMRSRDHEQQKPRYREVSCEEAQRVGFFGTGFPAYDTDLLAAFTLVEKMRAHDCDMALRSTGQHWIVEHAAFGGHASAGDKSLAVATCLAFLEFVDILKSQESSNVKA